MLEDLCRVLEDGNLTVGGSETIVGGQYVEVISDIVFVGEWNGKAAGLRSLGCSPSAWCRGPPPLGCGLASPPQSGPSPAICTMLALSACSRAGLCWVVSILGGGLCRGQHLGFYQLLGNDG